MREKKKVYLLGKFFRVKSNNSFLEAMPIQQRLLGLQVFTRRNQTKIECEREEKEEEEEKWIPDEKRERIGGKEVREGRDWRWSAASLTSQSYGGFLGFSLLGLAGS